MKQQEMMKAEAPSVDLLGLSAAARLTLLSKAHVSSYTRKDGVFVAEHDDKRAAAKQEAPKGSINGPRPPGDSLDMHHQRMLKEHQEMQERMKARADAGSKPTPKAAGGGVASLKPPPEVSLGGSGVVDNIEEWHSGGDVDKLVGLKNTLFGPHGANNYSAGQGKAISSYLDAAIADLKKPKAGPKPPASAPSKAKPVTPHPVGTKVRITADEHPDYGAEGEITGYAGNGIGGNNKPAYTVRGVDGPVGHGEVKRLGAAAPAGSAKPTIKTGNEGYGFHGEASMAARQAGSKTPTEDAGKRFSNAAHHLVDKGHFKTHEEARDFLDSTVGRHMHDELMSHTKDSDLSKLPADRLARNVNWYKKEKGKGKVSSATLRRVNP